MSLNDKKMNPEKLNREEELINLVSQMLGIEKEKITLDSDFYSDLNASRIELADLILGCQQKFNISLEENAIDDIKTVSDLLRLFEEKSDEI